MRISDWSSAVCSSDLISASSSEGVGESPADEILVGVARLTDQRAFLEFAQHRGIAGDGEEAEAAGGEIALELVAAEQRSEERRVGKEGVSTCKYRWSQ